MQDLEVKIVIDEQEDFLLDNQEEDIHGEIFFAIETFGMLDLADDERTNNEDF